MTTLLVGFSTRALAESASNAGEPVMALDYFGDMDQKERVTNISLARDLDIPFGPEALLETARTLAVDQVVYTSSLENHPRIVEGLNGVAPVLGNGPETLARVRNPRALDAFCKTHGFAYPHTLLSQPHPLPTGSWLVKPLKGGGGRGIYTWDGKPLAPETLLQAQVSGLPASAVFAANGKEAVVLGLTRQLTRMSTRQWRPRLPGSDAGAHAWAGNLFPLAGPGTSDKWFRDLDSQLEAMVAAAVREFGLKGVGSLDVIARTGRRPMLLEINPRYSGSMELLERGLGINLFRIHVDACRGILPAKPSAPPAQCHGKGVVFAHRDLRLPDTRTWDRKKRKDLPFPGDTVPAHAPVCTLHVSGPTPQACLERLITDMENLKSELEKAS